MMSTGAIYIALGAGILAWRSWLLAALMRDAERISLPAHWQYYEAVLQQFGPKRVSAAVRVWGIAVAVGGLALLLNG
jgi:hypothetical protein